VERVLTDHRDGSRGLVLGGEKPKQVKYHPSKGGEFSTAGTVLVDYFWIAGTVLGKKLPGSTL